MENFMQVVEEKKDGLDGAHIQNVARQNIFSEKTANRIFKFKLNEKVILARRASVHKDVKGDAFSKSSIRGHYGAKVYRVVERALRSSRDRKTLLPVYKLNEEPGKNYGASWIYEAELKSVRGRDSDSDSEADSEKEKEETATESEDGVNSDASEEKSKHIANIAPARITRSRSKMQQQQQQQQRQ
jgi:hypothetical protein